MGWNSSNRRERLPNNWDSLRIKVLRRDRYKCQSRGSGCNTVATDVDHILRGDDHSLSNLQSLCSVCHRRKTLAEAQEARRTKKSRRFRPIENHPGMR